MGYPSLLRNNTCKRNGTISCGIAAAFFLRPNGLNTPSPDSGSDVSIKLPLLPSA